MTRRGVLLLGVAAAAATGAAFLLAPDSVERAELTARDAALAFPTLGAGLATARRIEIAGQGEPLVLLRQGEHWVLPARQGYRARPERVREALVGLSELRLLEPRTADPAQYERLGLADPGAPGSTALLVRVLGDADAVLVELILGRRRVRTQGGVPESAFVRLPGQAQSWLAEARLVADTDPDLWIDRDVVNILRSHATRMVVRRDGERELVFAPTAELDLDLIEPADAPPRDERRVSNVSRALEAVTFQEVLPESQVPGIALGETRVEVGPELAITIWPTRERDQLWLRLRAEGGAEAERLDARWRGWAYRVGAWKEAAILPRFEDLFEPAEPPPEPPVPVR